MLYYGLVVLGALSPSRPVIDRRHVIGLGAGALASPALPAFAGAPAPAIELVVPQASLVAALATAPARTVVITGANSGVGLAGSKLLVAAGHRVILACRNQAKAEAACATCTEFASARATRAGGSARPATCDLSSLESVRAFAASIKGAPLDTLVCNAGLAPGAQETQPRRTAEGFEETVGVNHLGHFLLLNLLTPGLAASKGRLVLTGSPVHDPTSGGGDVGSKASLGTLAGLAAGPSFEMADGGPYDPDKAYKDSKLCNLLTLGDAARRLEPKGITVNAFSPGLIADPKGFFRNQNPTFAAAFNRISQLAGVAETNEFGGSALAYMGVDPALDGVTGAWYDTLPPGKHQLARHAPSAEARDVDEQRRLWELSAKLVSLA